MADLDENETGTHAKMAKELPQHVIIQSSQQYNRYLRLNSENPDVPEAVRFVGDYSFGLDTRFEVVQATTGNGLVHIRCLANNKYLAAVGNFIAAMADKTEEKSVPLCTLFQPIFLYNKNTRVIRLRHAHTRRFIEFFHASGHVYAMLALKTSNSTTTADVFTFIDFKSVVVLPKLIRIKGHNGNHLKAFQDGFMDFQHKADNSSLFDFEVSPSRDGGVRLRSIYYNKYWTAFGTWVLLKQDSSTAEHEKNTVFLPSKRVNHITLRCLSNEKFCRVHTTNDKRSCLAALETFPGDWSKMEIEEPVILKKIENVRYDWSKVRRFNERTVGIVSDDSSHRVPNELVSKFKLQTTVTNKFKWSTSSSSALGTSITITAGKAGIVSAGYESSREIGNTWKTEDEKEEKLEVGSVLSITMPPMTRVKATLMETRFSYEIPFSYTLTVVSKDGRTKITEMDDGLYTGENGYDHRCEILPFPLE